MSPRQAGQGLGRGCARASGGAPATGPGHADVGVPGATGSAFQTRLAGSCLFAGRCWCHHVGRRDQQDDFAGRLEALPAT
eukprot:465479-Lingulodinium_polyedra.AAC.1